MARRRRILLARSLDRDNTNAQSLNAKALTRHWRYDRFDVHAFHHHQAAPHARDNPHITLIDLGADRLWRARALWRYLNQPWDLVFYPDYFDSTATLAVRLLKRLRPRTPVVTTLEGLAGDAQREALLSQHNGHKVYCMRGRRLDNWDSQMQRADRIAAISPFLARMGRVQYGDKIDVLPLGVDLTLFHPPSSKAVNARPQVVSVGNLNGDNKRPSLFLALAQRYAQADFIWVGDGDQRSALRRRAQELEMRNLSFPGPYPAQQVADLLRQADIFVMTSESEGNPKSLQEAVACGLPGVARINYQPPSIEDGLNGFLAEDDEQLAARVGQLINTPQLAREMGAQGARMAQEWSWEQVAPQWEAWLDRQMSDISAAQPEEA
ncbi:glycosyltransferase [Magnetofaba australis]|uniref:Putative glycosyl transferase, group 1 n=1 Tax=Magnetofaba australis IT-1 TaxID=1434232 RepID=A0A1Y2K589_9PROT|nr:glycosyltransferase [Magnetofaba australis]OSM04799.1 putative glycosyl transferase, group 1 [Magnetofaba australis IT-1]